MSGVHVGKPPMEWETWESRLVHFHHFESVTANKGQWVESPIFRCCNHEWKLKMLPGGKKGSTDGKMAFYLTHCSGPAISVRFLFLIRESSSGDVKVKKGSSKSSMFPEGRVKARGYFVGREEIINALDEILTNGTLTVEVRIKPDDDYYCLNFIPKNAIGQNILRSFMDEKTADVVFEVESIPEENARSELSKLVQFHVHKLVLQLCAEGSTLASLCEACDGFVPVLLSDVDPLIFRQMLYYIYGGSIAAIQWKNRAKDFIDAADRYGVKNLKIEAEAWYVKHLEITVDNVIGTLQYADEKNCFLLKEAATRFMLTNAKALHASDSFETMPVSNITREIVSIIAMMNIQRNEKKEEFGDPTRLSINELRAKLYDDGKDIDGPRNALVAQLKPKNKSNSS